MSLKIAKAGKSYNVVESGFCYLSGDGKAEIIIGLGDEKSSVPLNIRISFLIDDGKPRLDYKAEGNSLVNVICYNFSSLTGTGTPEPINLGTFRDKTILLDLWSYDFSKDGRTNRRLDYCVYLEA